MLKQIVFVILATMSLSASAEYSFEIANNTDSDIVGIVVSEDGENWGKFNIGEGIEAGTTSKLVWDSSTDDSGCEFFFMARFSDGSDSELTAFDFCEEDLVLEFN
ncbi:MAG: hypothetical protein IPK97_13610 [Ahniella sp.]|nr:hypothetical protein [Ahniella sp.]